MPICNDVIKTREIRFAKAGLDQAEKAMKLLADVDGIKTMSTATCSLRISYDVQKLTLQMIEAALIEVGFSLDNSLIVQIKRGLFAYCEEALRSSLGIEEHRVENNPLALSDTLAHDPRPDNWRHYI